MDLENGDRLGWPNVTFTSTPTIKHFANAVKFELNRTVTIFSKTNHNFIIVSSLHEHPYQPKIEMKATFIRTLRA